MFDHCCLKYWTGVLCSESVALVLDITSDEKGFQDYSHSNSLEDAQSLYILLYLDFHCIHAGL